MSALVGSAIDAAAQGRSSPVLVSYSFEDDVPTGPDTFAVFEHARGHVRLSSEFRVSGFRSVEISDVAGDGDFPELQGYYPVRRSGTLYAHFALLVANPDQELDVALAGPGGFQLGRDGIAVWLRGLDGWLIHVSDSIPKRLVRIEPFVWYGVDLAYRVDAGEYDIVVRREGSEDPVVSLLDQPGAAAQPGSAVDKFSFVGDPGSDRSSVTYWVDDVMLVADAPVTLPAFVAPGRRKLFVDWFAQLQADSHGPRCLPAWAVADVLGDEGTERLRAEGRLADARPWLDPAHEPGTASPDPRLEAWREGCQALVRGDAARARERLEAAASDGVAFQLSLAVAAAAAGSPREATVALAEAYARAPDDPRYAIAAALVGLARDDLDEAERWLRGPAGAALEGISLPRDPAALARFRRGSPDSWREDLGDALAADQYFFVLTWRGDWSAARAFALQSAERLAQRGLPAGTWRLRAGDAAFALRDLDEARGLYEQARRDPALASEAILRLADVAYLGGDLEAEQRLRESLYGALRDSP